METSASFYYETYDEAAEEVHRRKSSPEGQSMIHRIMDSPYGDGYVVQSIDAELFGDLLIDGTGPNPQSGLNFWPKGTTRR